MNEHALKRISIVIATYLATTGAFWGALEAYAYFRGDELKQLLGDFWVILFLLVPLIFAISAALIFKASKPSNEYLETIWDCLDPGLQDALALAYNQSLREGYHNIQTRNLFAALVKINPSPLKDLFTQLPDDSLPIPLSSEVSMDEKLLKADRDLELSHCVRNSLTHLSKKASQKRKIQATDIFVDIAKHGTGRSVKRLRTHDIDAERINQLIRQLGWQVIDRD